MTVGLDSEKRLFLRKDAKSCEKRQNNGQRGKKERGKDVCKTYRWRKYGILLIKKILY